MGKLESLEELFAGRHFDRDVIILCVRWYLRFKLSLRDLVEMMGERGLSLAHTTIMRWVRHYTPEFEKRWRHYALQSAGCGALVGRTVGFRLSPRRDVAAAKAFFRKAINNHWHPPQTITPDGYAASHRAVHEMKAEQFLPADTTLRSSKYLNNLIEQDHRNIKSRVNAMLCFKRFRNAAITISGVELMHRIRKGQFNVARLRLKDTTAPAVWKAVLSA